MTTDIIGMVTVGFISSIFIYVVIAWFIFGIICAYIAGTKNRSQFGWFIVGTLLGFLGLIVIAVVPKNE